MSGVGFGEEHSKNCLSKVETREKMREKRKIKILVVASPVNVVGPCGNASSFFMNTHGCSSAVLHQCCAQSPSTNFIDWSPLDKWSPNEKCQLSTLITKQQKVFHHLVKPTHCSTQYPCLYPLSLCLLSKYSYHCGIF